MSIVLLNIELYVYCHQYMPWNTHTHLLFIYEEEKTRNK